MNENLETKKPEQRQRGTAAGDDWMICKSKSRNNQTYYFNTLTGQSVWTLSEANKEKAVIQTSQECPEPAEPAVKPSTSQTNNVQTIVANPAKSDKEQVIDYQFVHPPPILMSGFGVPQLSNVSNFPIIWDRPPPNYPYPILTVPAMPLQPNTSNKHDIIVQNTTVPLSQRFKQIKEQSKEPVVKPNQNVKVINTSFKPIRPKRLLGLDDLRMKLTAKRKMQCIPRNSERYLKDFNKTERCMHQLNMTDEEKKEPELYGNFKIVKDVTQDVVGRPAVEIEKESCDEEDQIWLAENMYIKDQKSQIDVSPLRDGAPDGANTECWYIMADTNVYYKNLTFLNILIHSDTRCYLLVSKTVMNELARKANLTASKANDFLRTALLSGKARSCGEIGSSLFRCACVDNDTLDPGNVRCPLGDDQILKCCLRIAASNYHVILLSEDRLLERKVGTTSIPIFKVEKIKELLAQYRKEQDEKNHSKEILITINNNEECNDTLGEIQDEPNLEAQVDDFEEVEYTEPCQTYEDDEENIQQETIENYLPSIVNENGLDLDSSEPQYLPTSPESPKKENNMVNLPSSKTSDTGYNMATSETEFITSGNIIVKKRIIRLKSRTELPRSPKENMKKPQLKWRRRPLSKPTPEATTESKTVKIPTKYSPKSSNKNQLIQEHDLKVCKKVEATIDKNKISPQENDDVASSIGNTSCSSKRNSKETSKIVEETSISSSDVIPNSQSSINSDNPKLNLNNYSVRKSTPAYAVVPKPMDNTMVYNLRWGCEELVSLFVQIMEDMFTQVLLHIKIPKEEFLPLNLHDATECVKIQFHDQKEVREDASNFLDFLLEFKDARGNLRRDLKPEDYMRMFGCGEKLVRSLSNALPDHEDIETSLVMLNDLMNDIKDPKSNESFSFLDDKYDCVAGTDDHYGERCQPPAETNSHQARLLLEPHSPTDYQETNIIQETKFVRTVPKGALDDHINRKKQSPLCSQQLNGDVEKPNSAAVEKDTHDVPKKPGPKISCEFKICPLIEDKLKLKARGALDSARNALELEEGDLEEELDYEEEIEEGDLDQNYSDVEIDPYKHEQISVDCREVNRGEAEDTSGSNENDEQLASFIKIFMREIKDTFLYVNNFCQDTYSELEMDNLSVSRRLQIETKANDYYIMLDTLLGKLNRILIRESNGTEHSIKYLTKASSFLGTKLSTYRDVILKCTEQAMVFLDALNSIKNLNNLSSGL